MIHICWFFLIDEMVHSAENVAGSKTQKTVSIHITIFYFNSNTLKLTSLEPQFIAPQSKHYVVRYYWFYGGIDTKKIS